MKRKGAGNYLTAYNPPGCDALIWGVPVLNAGFEPFPPGKPYPARDYHSAPYLYAWEQGRVFSEYQFLAITRGGGIFSKRPPVLTLSFMRGISSSYPLVNGIGLSLIRRPGGMRISLALMAITHGT